MMWFGTFPESSGHIDVKNLFNSISDIIHSIDGASACQSVGDGFKPGLASEFFLLFQTVHRLFWKTSVAEKIPVFSGCLGFLTNCQGCITVESRKLFCSKRSKQLLNQLCHKLRSLNCL